MAGVPPPGALALAEASIDHDEGFPVRADGLSHPYWDAIGRVWTIGTGLTRLGGQPVTQRTGPITRAQNDAAVGIELAATSALIAGIVTVALAPCEWAALANWMFNVGGHAAAGSTLIRKLNARDKPGACQQFAVWIMANGKAVPGLRNRRLRTAALFSGQAVPGVTDQPGMPGTAARRAVPGEAGMPASRLVATITPTPRTDRDAPRPAGPPPTDALVEDATATLPEDPAGVISFPT